MSYIFMKFKVLFGWHAPVILLWIHLNQVDQKMCCAFSRQKDCSYQWNASRLFVSIKGNLLVHYHFLNVQGPMGRIWPLTDPMGRTWPPIDPMGRMWPRCVSGAEPDRRWFPCSEYDRRCIIASRRFKVLWCIYNKKNQ